MHLVDVQPRLSLLHPGRRRSGRGRRTAARCSRSGEVGRDEAFVGMSSVTARVTAYRLGLATAPRAPSTGSAPRRDLVAPPRVVTERRRATSHDGTEVPYFLVRRADLTEDGPRPTLLWGYGGFDKPMLATTARVWLGWLAAGGVLAIANLRGGGEFGTAWHDGGRLRAQAERLRRLHRGRPTTWSRRA